jgi:hypothetical protein
MIVQFCFFSGDAPANRLFWMTGTMSTFLKCTCKCYILCCNHGYIRRRYGFLVFSVLPHVLSSDFESNCQHTRITGHISHTNFKSHTSEDGNGECFGNTPPIEDANRYLQRLSKLDTSPHCFRCRPLLSHNRVFLLEFWLGIDWWRCLSELFFVIAPF